MPLRSTHFVLLLTALLPLCATAYAQAPRKAPNFRLLDTQGFSHEIKRYADADAIVLLAWDVKSAGVGTAADALKALATDFPKVQFFVLEPSPRADEHANAARIQTGPSEKDALLKNAHALLGSLGLKKSHPAGPSADAIPVLRDPTQTAVRALGFRGAFEALVLGPADLTVRFQGPLEGVAAALKQPADAAPVMADAPAPPIVLAAARTVDYATQIAPLVKEKCATCHHGGGTAPIAFKSYDKLKTYSDMVQEVLLTQRMPPWHADPAYGHFANDRSLSEEQQALLMDWIAAGAPRGEGDDPLTAVATVPPARWELGEPDTIVAMGTPYQLPAEGVLDYHVVKVPSGFTADKWISGVEVRPSNTKVLHHALIFIEYPEHLKTREPHVGGGTHGYFAGFVPGAKPAFFPPGTGKFAPAGAVFTFQMHYVTTGKPEEDRTELGFHFCKETPAERIETEAASDTRFQIPPGMRDVPVTAEDGFWGKAKLWGLSPHMHYRGSRFKYTAQYPDGSAQVLLSVPNYNFEWQTMYRFAEPLELPRGTQLVCEGGFDNSATNPANPNPKDTVHFGEQTFQEMFIGYYEYSAPIEAWERRLQKREEYMAKAKADFDARFPGVSSATPMTQEELIGSTWTDDRFVFTFKPDNILLVNSLIKGAWKMEDKRVIIDVAGEHFELDIMGKGLFFNGSYPIERVN